MKPFDDTTPEETVHDTLITQLQRIHHKPIPMTQTEQEQSVVRVGNRLFPANAHTSLREDASAQPIATPGTSMPQPISMTTPRRHVKILRFFNTFAAVLIVGALLSTALVFFTHHVPSSTTPIQSSPPAANPSGSPTVIRSQRGGLEAAMQLTSGPYFLSEVVVADLSLTNHTQTTFALQGVPATNPCEPALYVLMTGGSAPHFQLNNAMGTMSCPFMMMQFKPAQVIHIRQYVSLTDSGEVKFTLSARFLTTKTDTNGGQITTDGTSPLDGYWPTINIKVSPQIPQDRTLSFKRQGLHVLISAPPQAQSHLLYLYGVQCQDFQGSGNTASGNFGWQPLTTHEVVRPGCPGKNIQWTFAFSAPGYAIALGSYP